MYKNLLFIFIALWSFCMNGVSRDRKELLDFGWRFLKGEAPVGSVKPDFDDGKWRIVDLPHDWSIEGIPSKDEPSGGDGGYRPNGKGCYRKTFQINKEEIGKVFGLYFEGVYMNAEVFVNGSSLGTHHYGYSPFYHDITSLIKQGENVIVVNVDNSYQPNCRWYTGSGIYRHVWLTSTNPIYFKQWGTFITTPNVSEDKADVAISTEIINSYDNERELSLTTILYGPLGDEIGRTTKGIVIKPGETLKINQLLPVQKPQCWSPDSPSLYSARLSVAENNREIDSILESFGIRTISYSAEEGFKLNGNSLLLNGGCIHHDNGPLGAAAFDRAEIRKVQLMKEAGFEDGFDVELIVDNTTIEQKGAVFVQQQLSQINVNVKVLPNESTANAEKTSAPLEDTTVQMWYVNWASGSYEADGSMRSILHGEKFPPEGYNTAFWNNEEFNKLLDDALKMTDDTQIAEAYAKAQAIAWEECPWIFLGNDNTINAYKTYVTGIQYKPGGTMVFRTVGLDHE